MSQIKVFFNHMAQSVKEFLRLPLSSQQYQNVSDRVDEANRRNLSTLSMIAACIFFVLFLDSFVNPSIVINQSIYFVSFVMLIIIFCFNKAFSRNKIITLIGIYTFIDFLFILGIILSTFQNPAHYSVTFMVLLFALPLLFIDRPWRMNTAVLIASFLFIIADFKVKEQALVTTDALNACVYAFLSIVISTYMMHVKYQKYVYEYQARVLSETDLLTGVFNRNSFETNAPVYEELRGDDWYCIYFDANGLHEMNNQQGHANGDQMLITIASFIKSTFGESTYRIGGDEFVSFTQCSSSQLLEQKIATLRFDLERLHYDIAVGYSRMNSKNKDLHTITIQAEKAMYADKKAYYANHLHERHSF